MVAVPGPNAYVIPSTIGNTKYYEKNLKSFDKKKDESKLNWSPYLMAKWFIW
jgi:hypothetical protein